MPLSQLPSTLETVRLLVLCESDTLAKHAAERSFLESERGAGRERKIKSERAKD